MRVTLQKLKENIDVNLMKPPSFMAVLTADEYAYDLENGVYLIPIGCLRD